MATENNLFEFYDCYSQAAIDSARNQKRIKDMTPDERREYRREINARSNHKRKEYINQTMWNTINEFYGIDVIEGELIDKRQLGVLYTVALAHLAARGKFVITSRCDKATELALQQVTIDNRTPEQTAAVIAASNKMDELFPEEAEVSLSAEAPNTTKYISSKIKVVKPKVAKPKVAKTKAAK